MGAVAGRGGGVSPVEWAGLAAALKVPLATSKPGDVAGRGGGVACDGVGGASLVGGAPSGESAAAGLTSCCGISGESSAEGAAAATATTGGGTWMGAVAASAGTDSAGCDWLQGLEGPAGSAT